MESIFDYELQEGLETEAVQSQSQGKKARRKRVPKPRRRTLSGPPSRVTSSNSSHEEKDNSKPFQIVFLDQRAGDRAFFKLEAAKLVQANSILTHLITQAALEKYRLQESILRQLELVSHLKSKSSSGRRGRRLRSGDW